MFMRTRQGATLAAVIVVCSGPSTASTPGSVLAAAPVSNLPPVIASVQTDETRLEEALPTLRIVRGASPQQWSAYETQGDGRMVSVFVMHDLQPKPVVFLLQGSGCLPAFTSHASGRFDTTSLFQDVILRESNRVHFAVVEKPGVAPVRFTASMTHEQQRKAFERASNECTAEFYKNATKPVRVADVLCAIAAVSGQPWARGVILVGHSEGTHVATGVLRRARRGTVSGAALFASAGPVQFWSASVSSNGASREGFQSAFDRMRTLQNAPDDLMYEGLPARRYKTFWLESTPIEDVRDSDVPLFVAQGTRDGTLMASDLFAMEAVRQQPKRSLRYVVVEGADHAFQMRDGSSRVAPLFETFLDWVLNPERQTSIGVLR
jgi:pimeloyl-ACP methyl ester carboxylesterase